MKKKFKNLLLATKLTLILICSAGLLNGFGATAGNEISEQQQQTKVITGTVTDDTKQALPGASVIVKGTTIGIITDIDGKFSLKVPENAKTLVVSFVGMVPQEIEIGSKTTFNVLLVQETIG